MNNSEIIIPKRGAVSSTGANVRISAKPLEKTDVQVNAKRSAKVATKPAAKPVVKLAEKPVAKVTVKPAAKVIEKPVAKVAEKPVAKVAVKPSAKVIEKPVAKVIEKPVAKVIEKPVAKVAVKPAAKKGKKKVIIWPVILLFLIVLIAASYESFTQHYMPSQSIIAKFHSLGMLTSVPVLHKSSSGIWRYMGWIGSGMMLTLMLYSVRKRAHRLSGLAPLRSWLRVHIFLGLMGPLLIVFHSTFKFNGIIATSFWAMIITVCFGVLGRYIYGKIPRSLSGAVLKSKDIDQLVDDLDKDLGEHMNGKKISELLGTISTPLDNAKDLSPLKALTSYVINDMKNVFRIMKLRSALRKECDMPWKKRRETISLLKMKSALIRRKNLLSTSQKLLDYWHVVHIPLAVLMFTIMFIHIAAYYVFRPVV